jgi:hypothetical protein
MSYARRLSVTVTTIADGSATAYSDPIDYGVLSQIRYTKASSGNFSDGVGFTVTLEGTGETLWAEATVNVSATRAPRQPIHSTAGVAATYDGTRASLDKIAIVNDRIKIVIASGGDTKVGTFHFVMG